MDKEEVIEIFNDLISGKREEISFSRGYKVFEEMYKEFSKDFNLIRVEEKIFSTIRKGE